MLQTDHVTCMVISEKPDMVGKEVDIVSEEKGRDKDRVSDKEKDLAGEAKSAFNSGDWLSSNGFSVNGVFHTTTTT